MKVSLLGALLLVLLLSACGGNEPKEVKCKASLMYQDRTEGKHIVVPEGLDPLDELAEMPIPRADPDAPRFAPGVCDDMPPMIQVTND